MEFKYTYFQDQLENAYCGGYVLAAMINLFDTLPANTPLGMDIYHEVQELQRNTLYGQRKCFIDKMSQYLHQQNIEGTYSLPSSMALYAHYKGLNPTIYYNESKLKTTLISVIENINLEEFNIMVCIDEEMSLIHSYNIPIIKDVSNFFIANSIALVETGMHWIAIGNTEEKEEKKRYYDPWSANDPVYEYSGINIALNKQVEKGVCQK